MSLEVVNKLLFIWYVLGILPGVFIGEDSYSLRLLRGVDSLTLFVNFRLGVEKSSIVGWDVLLPWAIFREFRFVFF